MKSQLRKLFKFGFIAFGLVGFLALIVSTVHARSMRAEGTDPPASNPTETDWTRYQPQAQSSGSQTTLSNKVTPPNPEKDQCLHCHISGEDERIWTPPVRWIRLWCGEERMGMEAEKTLGPHNHPSR
jgi:hypothetical protein